MLANTGVSFFQIAQLTSGIRKNAEKMFWKDDINKNGFNDNFVVSLITDCMKWADTGSV